MQIELRVILKNIINMSGKAVKRLLQITRFVKKSELPFRENIHSILIISLHHLGDFLFAGPAIRAIRKKYPKAYIVIWIKSRTEQIVKDCSSVDEIVIFDEVCTDRTKESCGGWREKFDFAKKLKSKNFDLLADMSGVFDSILVGVLSGIKYRVGFSSQGLGFLFSKDVSIHKGEHLIEKYNAVAGALGAKVIDSRLFIELNNNDKNAAELFLRENMIGNDNPFICIHPGAGWPSKTWSLQRFAELADKLIENKRVKVVICGGENDVQAAEKIAGQMLHKPIIAAGRFSLGETSAIINKCSVYVGHDSGPSYIAEALGRPLLVLFGPTNPVYSAPRTKNSVVISKKLSCSPGVNMQNCHNRPSYPCRHRRCMQEISVDNVLEAIGKLLNENKQRLKILYLITELEFGGAENLLLELSRYISREYFDVSIGYLKGKGTLKEDFKKIGIRVVYFNMRSRLDVFCIFRLAGFIRKEKFDIVHTHLIDADIFGYFGAKIAGVSRIVSTKHSTDDFRKRKTISVFLDAFVANRICKNIAVSNAVREFLIKHQKIAQEKIKVVYHGINVPRFSWEINKDKSKVDLDLNSEEYIVGVIGRFEKEKGHIFLIEAINKIMLEIKNIHFVFLGEGSLKESMQEKINSLNLNNKATFLSARKNVESVLNALDILVMPSLWEGLGMASLEAMAAGVPVLASDVEGIREVVKNNETGILVPPADSGELANQVLALLKDEPLRSRLSKNGRDFVEKNFNINKFVNEMELLYKQLKRIE